MNKSEMLETLVDYYSNGNKSRFATMLGIKPQTLNSWLMRNSMDLELVYSHCEGVSAKWLLSSGKGEMLDKIEKKIRDQVVHNLIQPEKPVENNQSQDVSKLLELLEQDKKMLLMKDQQIGKLIDMLDKKTDETFGLAAEERR